MNIDEQINFLTSRSVDFISTVLHALGVDYFKQVPTTDPNLTFALSISVFFIIVR